ncbi:MAG TPA: hypothetical protein VJP86_15845 [Vicinamibacterales bacterium]|nr:hypothetical protein [Vicinamibacterales bacterium]
MAKRIRVLGLLLCLHSCIVFVNPSDLPVASDPDKFPAKTVPAFPARTMPAPASSGAWLTPFLGATVFAQSGSAAAPKITVTETAGIRRTEYPVRARVALARGTLTDLAHAQLAANNAPVPAQFSIASKWPDGSVQNLDVAFNVTLAPGESRELQVNYGPAVTAAPPPRGLMVTQSADGFQIGTAKFTASGNPLLPSASYVRSEFIGSFAGAVNGFAVVDKNGARHDLSTAQGLKAELVEPGPLLAVLRYSGSLPAGDGSVPFTLTIEMPNSKSWIKMSASVTDTGHRVQRLSIDTPLALGAFPWQWDISTENGSYGAFRAATDAMAFTQVIPEGARSSRAWRIDAGAAAKMNLVESSVPATANSIPPPSWRAGHLQGSTTAVAFAIDRVSASPGEYTISLNGQGQASYRFAPAASATTPSLIVYQHFVSTPIAIGAATSPASMLQPPQVR